jgi:hypothetical protein
LGQMHSSKRWCPPTPAVSGPARRGSPPRGPS